MRSDAADGVVGWLRARLPASCGVAGGAIGDLGPGLFADEEAIVAKAGLKRRGEFRAGRHFARVALGQIGGPAGAILARAERDPIWPAGFVGSISHTDGHAIAVAAPAGVFGGVGVDFEPYSALDASLAALVCRAEERLQAAAFDGVGIDHAMLCFVAKEAYFKAVFPTRRRFLEFHDVTVAFDIDQSRFRVSTNGDGVGWFMVSDAFAVALFAL